MQYATHHSIEARQKATHIHFPPLDLVTKPAVPTEQAAYYLMRRPQTLRGWACAENGPIRPVRLHGRLAWPVADLKRLLSLPDVAAAGRKVEG